MKLVVESEHTIYPRTNKQAVMDALGMNEPDTAEQLETTAEESESVAVKTNSAAISEPEPVELVPEPVEVDPATQSAAGDFEEEEEDEFEALYGEGEA